MPKTTVQLSHNEVKAACAYWVEMGCPHPQGGDVYLTIEPGSNDPREPSAPSVSATVGE